jgi:hypothetical protein
MLRGTAGGIWNILACNLGQGLKLGLLAVQASYWTSNLLLFYMNPASPLNAAAVALTWRDCECGK